MIVLATFTACLLLMAALLRPAQPADGLADPAEILATVKLPCC